MTSPQCFQHLGKYSKKAGKGGSPVVSQVQDDSGTTVQAQRGPHLQWGGGRSQPSSSPTSSILTAWAGLSRRDRSLSGTFRNMIGSSGVPPGCVLHPRRSCCEPAGSITQLSPDAHLVPVGSNQSRAVWDCILYNLCCMSATVIYLRYFNVTLS